MLQWFRKKLLAADEAPAEAPPPAATHGDSEDDAEARPSADASEPKRKRRRGSRGGRGRRKTGEAGAASSTAVAEPPRASSKPEREGVDESAPARSQRGKKDEAAKQKRRRPAPRRSSGGTRAALADVKKEIVVSVGIGEQRVAVLEDGKPAEVYLERPGRRSIAGNVYKGVVDNVLPGMEASFVDIGLERNGFLYVDEIVVPELEGKRHGRRIQELIQRGEEVLVQAVKDPMGTKGARLTTEISLPGRFLVYTPFGEGIGISRRLEDAERERLKSISKQLEFPEGGVIIRTAAEGASKEELEGDLGLLRKLWATIQGRADGAKTPVLVYREAELPLRIVRDLFIRDFERVVVDHDRTHRRIVSYLKRTSTDLAGRVELYNGREPLMEAFGVDAAVGSTLDRRVDLPSGGYLIFDYAEAFTVIDVNTGRFVGGRGKASGARLEDTITKNNLEAVEEVVRQLRLRDIGGIIVIDFIDMANPKNRAQVEEALKRELEKDRTKTYVVEISPLGLVEMTRQNVTDGPREILTILCSACGGDGVIVSDETHAVNAERELRHLVRSSRHQAFLVEMNSRVAGNLIGPGAARLRALEEETKRRFFFETRDDVPAGHLNVLAKGPVSRLALKALPVAAGDELDLRLDERHAHEAEDAVGRLNGYAIEVAGGRSKLGKTAKVRVEGVTRTTAYAVLADAIPDGEPPVEAAAELEREDLESGERPPTVRRTSRSRRTNSAEKRGEAESSGMPGAPEALDAPAAVAEGEATADSADAEEPERPRKRTRRGTRGGRGRKKKSTAADTSGDGAEASVEDRAAPVPEGHAAPAAPAAGPERDRADGGAEADDEPEAGTAATEAAPSEEDDGEEKPKKRTRRGSRGGRNRRRKRAAVAGEEAGAAEVSEPVTAVADETEPG